MLIGVCGVPPSGCTWPRCVLSRGHVVTCWAARVCPCAADVRVGAGTGILATVCVTGVPPALKAMTLMEYLIKTGSERVSQQCKENMYAVQTLKDFQYVDRDGKDQGVNVREKAKQLVALLRDEDRLREERAHALKTKEKLAQTATGEACLGSPPRLCALTAPSHLEGRPTPLPS